MQLSTELPISALVDIYNKRLSADTAPLKSWKQSKDKLIKRIADLPPGQVGTKRTAKKAPNPQQVPNDEERQTYLRAIAAVAISPRDSIQVAAEKLLEAVAYEHDGRKWGIPYTLALDEVRRVFPEGNTTIACLRWYAAHMNSNGVTLPSRKRSRS